MEVRDLHKRMIVNHRASFEKLASEEVDEEERVKFGSMDLEFLDEDKEIKEKIKGREFSLP